MHEPTEQGPRYCTCVAWNAERLDLRFPAHGVEECRATGRGVEVHACRRRAGHDEDLLAHLCYCGQTWTDEGRGDGGADKKTAGPAAVTADSAPRGQPPRGGGDGR